MLGIPREDIKHVLDVLPNARPVMQCMRHFDKEKWKTIGEEIARLLATRFIKEVLHPEWIANPVLVWKQNRMWHMCVDYTSLNKACPKVPYPYHVLIRWSIRPWGAKPYASWTHTRGTTRSR
jgi:hypothetical protein